MAPGNYYHWQCKPGKIFDRSSTLHYVEFDPFPWPKLKFLKLTRFFTGGFFYNDGYVFRKVF